MWMNAQQHRKCPLYANHETETRTIQKVKIKLPNLFVTEFLWMWSIWFHRRFIFLTSNRIIWYNPFDVNESWTLPHSHGSFDVGTRELAAKFLGRKFDICRENKPLNEISRLILIDWKCNWCELFVESITILIGKLGECNWNVIQN